MRLSDDQPSADAETRSQIVEGQKAHVTPRPAAKRRRVAVTDSVATGAEHADAGSMGPPSSPKHAKKRARQTVNGGLRPASIGVLLVEDDSVQAEPLLELLRRKLPDGSSVAHEKSLARALSNLSNSDHDVVLLDLGLPDSNGISTVEAVRGVSAEVAIIILTGREDDETVEAGLQAGADDYFVKGQITVAGLVRAVGYAAERKRGARALSNALESFRQLADSMPTIVWTARPDGYRDYYNQRWYELTGLSADSDVNQSWEEILHPDDQEACGDAWERAIKTGQPYRMEYRFRDQNSGLFRWYLGRALPIRNEGSEIVRWYGTGTDIHELKLAQEERARAQRELERRVEERTAQLAAANLELEAFSYSVSHDLRTPLRAISGFSRILLEEHASRLDGEALRYLENVQDGARQMGQLVDDLLAFSRLGRHPLAAREISVMDLIETALAQLEPMKENRRIEITVAEMPACTGDATLLQQVWVNLLSNAMKYTRERDPAVIAVGSRRENGTDVFFVKDNGAGFDMKYSNKLFGVFQRLHRADEYEGTGVGLALVQRIIQRHGGRIWAEAKVNEGATFFFNLGGRADG